jgi:hypothetical protein
MKGRLFSVSVQCVQYGSSVVRPIAAGFLKLRRRGLWWLPAAKKRLPWKGRWHAPHPPSPFLKLARTRIVESA